MHAFLNDRSGVTSIEYALLASLIAIVIATTVSLLGQNLAALWQQARNCMAYAANKGSGTCP
ncbi:Flp family type IVb pilin [Noviherbaspirillum pedocola]|uniref:Flp family type IVb pilin n=1 Tax=Noviherbaspirillum pedocola TaxID=2801341 RepID=A0A934W5E5_9BURK|nr:Flp family type IVb pilin [Noviherbaspirillum pedocola]MBK4733810.1 Flp family type IVb pilin [Noviherbaspirillum pedocola]